MALIDRGRVMIDYIENLGRKDTYKAKYEALSRAVDEAPTIDAEPVRHGRWEWRETWGDTSGHGWDEPYDAGWACSACGVDLMRYLQSHFSDIPSYAECASDEMPTVERCPNCGAKMDAHEFQLYAECRDKLYKFLRGEGGAE